MNNDIEFLSEPNNEYPHPSSNPLLNNGNDFVEGRWTDD